MSANARHAHPASVRPGKPAKNAYVESFHDERRSECIDLHWFTDLANARAILAAQRDDYNTMRPDGALQRLTPHEFARSFIPSR